MASDQIVCDDLWKVFGANSAAALKAIQAEGIDKAEAQEKFGCVIGVAGCSLEIKKGETFCIMGLSGSGKSTLLRHINRLIEPTAGRVWIDGKDISKLDSNALMQLRSPFSISNPVTSQFSMMSTPNRSAPGRNPRQPRHAARFLRGVASIRL